MPQKDSKKANKEHGRQKSSGIYWSQDMDRGLLLACHAIMVFLDGLLEGRFASVVEMAIEGSMLVEPSSRM